MFIGLDMCRKGRDPPCFSLQTGREGGSFLCIGQQAWRTTQGNGRDTPYTVVCCCMPVCHGSLCGLNGLFSLRNKKKKKCIGGGLAREFCIETVTQLRQIALDRDKLRPAIYVIRTKFWETAATKLRANLGYRITGELRPNFFRIKCCRQCCSQSHL